MTDYAILLKENGLKATFQRTNILDVVEKNGHMSIEAIYDEVSKIHPSLSLATIYKNIILMVTKEMHALGDILIRHEEGELEANILAVISNYDKLESLVSKFNIPYVTISHVNLEREVHEAQIIECINSYKNFDCL